MYFAYKNRINPSIDVNYYANNYNEVAYGQQIRATQKQQIYEALLNLLKGEINDKAIREYSTILEKELYTVLNFIVDKNYYDAIEILIKNIKKSNKKDIMITVDKSQMSLAKFMDNTIIEEIKRNCERNINDVPGELIKENEFKSNPSTN